MSVLVRTSDGLDVSLPISEVDRLAGLLHGRVILPGAPGYDEARTVWNAMIDRRPGLVVRCAATDDVAHTIRFAREHHLLVSVRGGGHNIAGNAVSDGALLIDLSPMKAIHVDVDSRVARAGPGLTLGELDAETQRHGLATPLGINSTTGVAGLTLGGGFGWLSRRLGLTVDNLLAAEVVTAAGEVVRANESQHADLFWAIRGGGGNFGVVTSFELRLHPVGPQVLAGLVVHPLADAADVFRAYRDFVTQTSDELACWVVMRQAPPAPFIPEGWHGKGVIILAMCWSGELEAGRHALQPMRAFGNPIADTVGPIAYTAWQTALDPLLTPGARNYWKSHDFTRLSDGLIEVLRSFARQIPDPQCEIALAELGGAVSRVPAGATAYAHRDARFVMNVHGRWSDAGRDEACIEWARALFAAAAPHATGGVYVNFLTADEGQRVGAAYGENLQRLMSIKTRYDPSNFFRINQNIRPSMYVMPGVPSPATSSDAVRH